MPSTPYVIGQWVCREKFYGRAALIEEILEGNRNSLWLLGTRRIGKTSLLKQVEFLTSASPDGGYFPIFWDFQGAGDPDELHGGLKEALLDADERLRRRGIDPSDLAGADLPDTLGRLRRRLRPLNLRLLLLCDEVEELIKLHIKDPALLGKLRRMLQREDTRSVLASTIRLWALADQRGDTSPFLHGFTPPVHLRGLGDEEARALIRQVNLPREKRPTLDDQAVEEIRQRCDNHPYLIQLVCKRYLELGDLPEAVEQVAADQMVSYFFSVDFEMLTPSERGVVRIIAEGSPANSDSILDKISLDRGELNGILLSLEQLGYVRRNPDRRFDLVNYFFRRWFREQQGGARPTTRMTAGRPTVRRESEETTQPLETGERVLDGRYRLLGQIGSGATGVVYKARDEVVGALIAIKVLRPQYCSDPELMARVRREIVLSRDIGHPHVLRVHHLGDCQGEVYLVMQLVEGPTLAKLIARQGPLETPRAVEIGWKLASALEALHARDIIHRDIKPQNILLDQRGEPYLTDFGLARLLTAPGMTETGVFLGTPDYASPEQAKRQPSDARSDLYSLGVVLFEIATGKRPFVAETAQKVLEMQARVPPPDPRQLRPALPVSLSHLILRCLQKDPALRYQDSRALRLALEELRGR